MASKIIADVRTFLKVLRTFQDESQDSTVYQEDIQIVKVTGEKSSLYPIYNEDRPIFICQKIVPKIEPCDEPTVESESDDETQRPLADPGPQPLTIMRARQLLSWYTMAQNRNMASSVPDPGLRPLWVRCDMADVARTAWMGAETICSGNKVCAVKLHSVTCKDATVDKASFITLDELKQQHKKIHHPSSMVRKGTAQYTLFGATVVENTTIEAQTNVRVNFKWTHVESILETPHLSSLATLSIRVASGDMRSPMFQIYKELEFLQVLADGLRTGETEWTEPLETRSAVELTQAYLDELQNGVKTLQERCAARDSEASRVKEEEAEEAEPSMCNALTERGDLDFVEQLWVRMRKSVTSYEDIGDCLKLVIKALQYGDIKPWVHRDSSSSLSKLILQSYVQQMAPVSLTGLTPVHMLLEMGLGKMRKDYANYLIGQELSTLNHLSYYLSTEVDLQEQVLRQRKLHHLLEIIVTCSSFLGLPYDRLFLLTQSCLQYYRTRPYDEDREFTLQVEPAIISHFYQKEAPVAWGVELCSGHAPREVRTSWQLSNTPRVDHMTSQSDFPNETAVNADGEQMAYFTTMTSCSLVSFT